MLNTCLFRCNECGYLVSLSQCRIESEGKGIEKESYYVHNGCGGTISVIKEKEEKK